MLADPQPALPLPASSADGFGSTAWSLVLDAAREDFGGGALDRLCRKYWKPIYAFARRSGLSAADGEDLTQDFFAYLLERSWLKQADPRQGSFRAFLLTLFRNFSANYRRRQGALKRRGSQPDLSFDAQEGEQEIASAVANSVDPSKAYDQTWATCVLKTSVDRLACEQEKAGKSSVFEALRAYLTQRPEAGDYDRLGRELGLTRNQVALQIHRLSRRYAEIIRSEISDTLVDHKEVESELRFLLAALAQ